MSRAHSTNGYTLVERLIMIIGDLAAIAVAMHMSECERARNAAVKSDVTYRRPSPYNFVVFGWSSLGLGDTDHAIRVA